MSRQSWGNLTVLVAAVLIHAAASVPIRVGAQTGSDEDVAASKGFVAAASFDAVAHVDSSVLLSKPVAPGLCDDVKQVMTQRRGPWCSQRHVCTLYCKH